MVTRTPGTTAPEASLAVPVMRPVSAWPNMHSAHRRRRHRAGKTPPNLSQSLLTEAFLGTNVIVHSLPDQILVTALPRLGPESRPAAEAGLRTGRRALKRRV